MIRETSGILVIEHIFDIISVYRFMHVGHAFSEMK